MWQKPINLEDQYFPGLGDSDLCWAFSGIACLEIVLNDLYAQLSTEAKQFLISNDYCDSSGNFALSRRYIGVLSGVRNNGNAQEQFWYLVGRYGIIPRSLFDFDPRQHNDTSYDQFVNDFFDPSSVTQEMKDLGQQFLKYFVIYSKDISNSEVDSYILKSPLQIGIPIPSVTENWNSPIVKWDGSTQTKHAVVLLGKNADQNRVILDSYLIWIKTLSSDYPMNIITAPLVSIRGKAGDVMVPYSVIEQFIFLLMRIGVWPRKSVGAVLYSLKSLSSKPMSILKNKYVLDILHVVLLVAPFAIEHIPARITSLTIGGILSIGLTWLKSKTLQAA